MLFEKDTPTPAHPSPLYCQRYVAYVRQEQSFYPFLTVRETLLIKAGLRLDRYVVAAAAVVDSPVDSPVVLLLLFWSARLRVPVTRLHGIVGVCWVGACVYSEVDIASVDD